MRADRNPDRFIHRDAEPAHDREQFDMRADAHAAAGEVAVARSNTATSQPAWRSSKPANKPPSEPPMISARAMAGEPCASALWPCNFLPFTARA